MSLPQPGDLYPGRRDHVVAIRLSDKERHVLDEIATRKEMRPQAVMWCALRWLQLLEETPGAYDAVMALRPSLGPFGCMGDDDDSPIPQQVIK